MTQNILQLKISFGNISDKVHSLFFLGAKNPNIVFIFKKESFFLWNLKIDYPVAFFLLVSKKWKEILTVDTFYDFELKFTFIGFGFDNGCIQIWKIDMNRSLVTSTTLIGHTCSICHIKMQKKSAVLVSCCNKGTIIIWDFVQKRGRFKIEFAHNGQIKDLFFLSSIRVKKFCLLSFGSDSVIKIWKIKKNLTNKVILIREKKISKVIYNFKKKILILISQEKKISFYCITKHLKIFLIGKFWKNDSLLDSKIFFNKTANFLFVSNGYKQINIFPFDSTKRLSKFVKTTSRFYFNFKKIIKKPVVFFFNLEIFGIDFWKKNHSKNCLLLLVHHGFHILQMYRFSKLESNRIRNRFTLCKFFKLKIEHHATEIREIKWFMNTRVIFGLSGMSKKIYTWCLYLKKSICKISTFSHGLCFIFYGKDNLIVGNKIGGVEIYNISLRKLLWVQSCAHKGPIWSIDTVKSNFSFITTGSDGFLKIWEINKKKTILTKILNLKEQIICTKVFFSKSIIVVCTLSSKISIFYLNTLQFGFSLLGHKLPIVCLTIKENSDILASGSIDASFGVWNLVDEIQRKIIKTKFSAITAIEFQKYIQNMFIASRCGIISCWKIFDYVLLYEIKKYHVKPIWGLKFSSDGKFIASSSEDKSIKIWKIKKNLNYDIYNFSKKSGLFILDKKSHIDDFFLFFLKLKKKEIDEAVKFFDFRINLSILRKITQIGLNEEKWIYNFEFIHKLLFFFRLLEIQIQHKQCKVFELMKKILKKAMRKIRVENEILKKTLSVIKKTKVHPIRKGTRGSFSSGLPELN